MGIHGINNSNKEEIQPQPHQPQQAYPQQQQVYQHQQQPHVSSHGKTQAMQRIEIPHNPSRQSSYPSQGSHSQSYSSSHPSYLSQPQNGLPESGEVSFGANSPRTPLSAQAPITATDVEPMIVPDTSGEGKENT